MLPEWCCVFLGRAGITSFTTPFLDSLAAYTGELLRLSVIDGDRLTWVAVAQGATGGLRYDPGQEQGVVVHLASSAGGKAWLSSMSDEHALARVYAQGLPRQAACAGPGAPRSLNPLLEHLAEARMRGHATAVDHYTCTSGSGGCRVRVVRTLKIVGSA